MDSKLKSLFTPWKIGDCEVKNRIVLTSMGGTDLFGWMERNHFDEAGAHFLMEVDYYEYGAGLIYSSYVP